MSNDEIAIYRVVLQHWVEGSQGALNVSVQTYPLEILSSESYVDCRCLRDIDPESLLTVSHSLHILTADVLPLRNMRLVDPRGLTIAIRRSDPHQLMREGKSAESAVAAAFANGVFALSEIAFDKAHRHAIVSYGFYCGSLCGSGITLVFEKVGDEWKRTKIECGGWIS